MMGKITYDPNGGWNMPTGSTQMGALTFNKDSFDAALKSIAKKLVEYELIKKNSGSFNLEHISGKIDERLQGEIHKQITYVRNEMVRKYRQGMVGGHDRGHASSAVFRRSYRDEFGGNVNISGNGHKMSSNKRPWQPGQILHRDISKRTRQINDYYGMDRAFILRILEVGRDSFMANSSTGATGRGSRATWGRRGPVTARGIMQGMAPRMERAADEVGRRIVKYAENILNNQ